MRRVASTLALISLATAGCIAACRNNVPPPALPPVAPELSRDAPRPRPIDPAKKKPAKVTMREMPAREVRAAGPTPDAAVDAAAIDDAPVDAPVDAGAPAPPSPPPVDADINDVIDLPEVPDAEGIVTDAATPLR